MTTKTTKSLTLDDLDAEKHGATHFKFPFLLGDGRESGVILHVISDESEAVKAGVSKLLNARRQADIKRASAAGGPAPTPVEDDTEFGVESAALRLVGWDGLAEEPTKANILKLCRSNAAVRAQIFAASARDTNFLQL